MPDYFWFKSCLLISTPRGYFPHGSSPLCSVLGITGRQFTIFEVFVNALFPGLRRPTRAPLTRNGPGSHSIYLTGGTHDMSIPPESALTNEDTKVTYTKLLEQFLHRGTIGYINTTHPKNHWHDHCALVDEVCHMTWVRFLWHKAWNYAHWSWRKFQGWVSAVLNLFLPFLPAEKS